MTLHQVLCFAIADSDASSNYKDFASSIVTQLLAATAPKMRWDDGDCDAVPYAVDELVMELQIQRTRTSQPLGVAQGGNLAPEVCQIGLRKNLFSLLLCC